MQQATRPRDLPELRLALLDNWRDTFAVHAQLTEDERFRGDPRFSHLDGRGEVHLLEEAELWWITPEMSALVRKAAESLPPTTLTDDLVPKGKGVLAFFADPLIGNDAALEGHQMRVQILVWGTAKLIWDPDPDHDYATVSMYSTTGDMVPGVPYMPVGRTDWLYGTDTEEATFDVRPDDDDARRVASMAQDRRWLAALALLAAEPLAEKSIVRQTNKAKIRKLKRSRLPSDVRLVGLRTAPRESTASGEGEPRKVNWSHRWIVGEDTGGYWKQQAYGPGWSLHRPRWIMPYEKGPKDKPLIVKDTVHVLRGDRPQA